MLTVRDLRAAYGRIEALRGVSLEVREGEIVALIGANGAGKTTLLRAISGLMRPTAGGIDFAGERLDGMPPHEVARRGVAQVPEGRRILPRMTVEENLNLGAFAREDGKVAETRDRVYGLFPVLKERLRQSGGTLSGGEQQMLAIGRALMAGPRLLMLDEPSMGLAPRMVETIFETIRAINAEGTPVLLVEQNAALALKTASRGYVMETGRVVLHDSGAALRSNDLVRRVYLGD